MLEQISSEPRYPYTAGILAGGKSLRMGRDKAFLEWNGQTFLGHSISVMRGFSRILISVPRGKTQRFSRFCSDFFEETTCEIVEDQRPGYGPLEGLYQMLCRMEPEQTDSEWIFVTAVDMPLLHENAIHSFIRICEGFLSCNPGYSDKQTPSGYRLRAIIPKAGGRLHPLCGFYHRSVKHTLEELFREGRHSMSQLADRIPALILPMDALNVETGYLANVNTPEDYHALCRQGHFSENTPEGSRKPSPTPPLFAICGVKNSGKTTFLEKIIRILSREGYRVAAIKHDGHDFIPDVPGTDSFRMREAGACGTAIFSDRRYSIHKMQKSSLEEICSKFCGCDLILAEGMKDLPIPKFEIIRQGVSDTPVSHPCKRFGFLTDIPDFFWNGEPVWNLNDAEQIAKILKDNIAHLKIR